MIGPAVPSDEDELREAIARTLYEHDRQPHGAPQWEHELLGDELLGMRTAYRTSADALLPVVRRYADQRAAEELRAAARDVSWPTVNATFFRRVLRARADALTREAAT